MRPAHPHGAAHRLRHLPPAGGRHPTLAVSCAGRAGKDNPRQKRDIKVMCALRKRQLAAHLQARRLSATDSCRSPRTAPDSSPARPAARRRHRLGVVVRLAMNASSGLQNPWRRRERKGASTRSTWLIAAGKARSAASSFRGGSGVLSTDSWRPSRRSVQQHLKEDDDHAEDAVDHTPKQRRRP